MGKCRLASLLFADDAVFLVESEEQLQTPVTDLDRMCESQKLKVSAEKSKVMIFERDKKRAQIT